MSEKLLKLAKQRKLAKLIQFSELNVQKASQCSGLLRDTMMILGSLSTREGECRNFETLETTCHQTLNRQDSEIFLTRSEEILSTNKCSPSMEVGVHSMQNKINILSILSLLVVML